MNQTYGTNIAMKFTPGQNFPQMGAAIVTTMRANQPAPTDVYIGTNQQIAVFGRAKAFTPIDWPALLPDRVDPSMVEGNGTAVRVHTVIPGGIIYNTRLAPYKPARLTDLLKPEWKGKIASQPYASNFDILSADGVWGGEKGLQFARDLSAQLGSLPWRWIARGANGRSISGAECPSPMSSRPISRAIATTTCPYR
jgi:ABC-type Fe3+ transport system substrate-binding protein